MKKRFLSVLLCVCMVLTLMPTVAYAEDSPNGATGYLLDVQVGSSGEDCSLSRYAGKCTLFYDESQKKGQYYEYPYVVNVPYKSDGRFLENVTFTVGTYGSDFVGFDWDYDIDRLMFGKGYEITDEDFKDINEYDVHHPKESDLTDKGWYDKLDETLKTSDDSPLTYTTVTIPTLKNTVYYTEGINLKPDAIDETPEIFVRFIKEKRQGHYRAYYAKIQFRMLPAQTEPLNITGIKVTNKDFTSSVQAVLGPGSGTGKSSDDADTLKFYCYVPTTWVKPDTNLTNGRQEATGNYIIECSDAATSAAVSTEGWNFVKPRWGSEFRINDCKMLSCGDGCYTCDLSLLTSGGYKKHAVFAELYVIPVKYDPSTTVIDTNITDPDIDKKLNEQQKSLLKSTLEQAIITNIQSNDSNFGGTTINSLSAYTSYTVTHCEKGEILRNKYTSNALTIALNQTTTISDLNTDTKTLTFSIDSTYSWGADKLTTDTDDQQNSGRITVPTIDSSNNDSTFRLSIPNMKWKDTLSESVYTRSGTETGRTETKVSDGNTIVTITNPTNISIRTTDCPAQLDTLYYDTLQDAVDNLKITPGIQNLTVDRVPESPATVNTISKINLKLTNSSDAENTYNPSSFLVGGEGIILEEDVDTSKLINKDGWTYNFVEGNTSESEDTISIETEGKGSVTVDNPKAKAGETVTITATPEEGYEVDNVSVTGSDESNIEVKNEGDNTYTFTMPEDNAQPVTVTVTFKESEQQNTAPNFVDVVANTWYSDAVDYVVEKGLMEGTSATTFAPNTTTTRGMVVTILHRLEGSPSATAARFSDVPSGQWYSDAVAWATANGIVTGYDNGNFGPNDMITREQMATILYRYAGTKGYNTGLTTGLTAYVDASAISPYANTAMSWATAAGLIKGTSGNTLSPAGDASRAEVATILMRFCENVAK